MNQNICLKSTARQPLRTLFFLLLLGVISFAFISRATEYLVVQQETNRLGTYYRSIGSLDPIDPKQYDVSEGAVVIGQNSYVAYEDKRRDSSGVLEGIYNADVDGAIGGSNLFGITNTDVLFYGELTQVSPVYEVRDGSPSYYSLSFTVDQVLTGYPEYVLNNQAMQVFFQGDDNVMDAMEKGQRYLIRAWYDYSGFGGGSWQNARHRMTLKPLVEDGPWFLPVDPNAEVDFSDPDIAALKEDLALLWENQHAMYVIATADMSAIPSMQEAARTFYLTEGRWLNHDDDLSSNPVCVVHQDFADMRALSIGDKITVTLRGLKNPYQGYIMDGTDRYTWQDYPTQKVTFTIVGLYSNVPNFATYVNTWMYIPASCLPTDFENQTDDSYLDLGLYSFVLESSQDQNAFLLENQQVMADLGLSILFNENHSTEFWAAVAPLRQSAIVNVLVFGGVLVLALALVVFLYLLQRRRDFAILRALGVPKRKAVRQMVLPIIFLGGVGISVGGFLSWRYALAKAVENLSSLPTPAGVAPTTDLNMFWLVGLYGGILVLLLLFARIGLRSLARRPVLELLQGGSAQEKKRNRSLRKTIKVLDQGTAIHAELTEPAINVVTEESSVENLASGNGSFTALARYILRHISRAPLKSLLTIAIALGFMLTLGWMRWTIKKNTAEVDHLYTTQAVEGEIVQSNTAVSVGNGGGIISREVIETVLESGFIQDFYLEAGSIRFLSDYDALGNIFLRAFDQPDKFFSVTENPFFTTEEGGFTVEYESGWDESLFSTEWTPEYLTLNGIPAVFPTEMLQVLDLNIGDVVYVGDQNADLPLVVRGKYIIANAASNEGAIFLPLSALDWMDGDQLRYAKAQFIFASAKNQDLPEFKQEMEALVSNPNAGLTALRFIFWDEELRSVIEPLEKNLSLMAVLYPVTIALSVLIAAGLCLLLVMQNSKDAAILRVLGMVKPQVRNILTGQQVLLSLIGLALGLGGLAILHRDPGAAFSGPALLSAGLYLAGALMGSLIGATLITRQKPLELLQVKE